MKSTEYARSLTVKAEHDSQAAEIGLEHGAPLDTICFHLQQAVEKLLKGGLAYRNEDYPLTHNLILLVDLAAKECPALAEFREAAMQTTRRIREAVHGWLPPEALPPAVQW